MEPNEEFEGSRRICEWGVAVSSRILQDMWAFLIATAIRPALFRVRSKAKMFCR